MGRGPAGSPPQENKVQPRSKASPLADIRQGGGGRKPRVVRAASRVSWGFEDRSHRASLSAKEEAERVIPRTQRHSRGTQGPSGVGSQWRCSTRLHFSAEIRQVFPSVSPDDLILPLQLEARSSLRASCEGPVRPESRVLGASNARRKEGRTDEQTARWWTHTLRPTWLPICRRTLGPLPRSEPGEAGGTTRPFPESRVRGGGEREALSTVPLRLPLLGR